VVVEELVIPTENVTVAEIHLFTQMLLSTMEKIANIAFLGGTLFQFVMLFAMEVCVSTAFVTHWMENVSVNTVIRVMVVTSVKTISLLNRVELVFLVSIVPLAMITENVEPMELVPVMQDSEMSFVINAG